MRRGWLGTIALLVAGCAVTPAGHDLPDISAWDARVAVLGELRAWEFRGRIAVKAGEDGFNGRFNWAQQEEAYRASVSGPIGMGTVRVEGDGRAVTLTDKDGVQTLLQDAELELQQRYGWTIPIKSLRYWALGIPAPGAPAVTEFDPQGLLLRLEQGGWKVEISRYQEGGGQQMPRILTASNPTTRVRIAVDRWIFLDR